MKMTVEDILKLKYLSDFKLLAGANGLNRGVSSVGILDYEPANELDQHFFKGDFMITSFYSLKDEPELMIKTVERLFDIGVAAIAVKNVIFKSLPSEVIEFCNKRGLPLFTYHSKVLSEQIIFEMVKALKDDEKDDYLASKIYGLLKTQLGPLMVKKIAIEINPLFYEQVQVVFVGHQREARQLVSTINNGPYKEAGVHALSLEGGILLIISFVEPIDILRLLGRFGLDLDAIHFGYSQIYSLEQLDRGISESLYAFQVAELEHQKGRGFESIGFYQWMLPLVDNEWLKSYSEQILRPLLAHDEKQKGDLMETTITFVHQKGDYKKTSEAMYQHVNTVRYKVAKAYTLAQLDNESGGAYEQLAVAIQHYLCQKNSRLLRSINR